jgi:hypothetical protein
MLNLAKTTGNANLLIAGHQMACTCYCFAGEFTKILQHADNVRDLYDDEKHRHLADLLNHDAKTIAGIYASISTWMLGHPDRALFDFGFALMRGAHQFDHRYDHEDLRKRVGHGRAWKTGATPGDQARRRGLPVPPMPSTMANCRVTARMASMSTRPIT